jgi:hypothetical protein
MIRSFKGFTRLGFVVGLLVVALGTLAPAQARAELPTRASFLDYGFQGFLLGVEVGLPIGYLSTGPTYESSEWRKLVFGAGIGALAGMSTGFVLAITDTTERGVGFHILRDSGYGALIGAALGVGVGALIWVNADSSDPVGKDMLKAGSFGALIGAGLGAIYGVFDGASASKHQHYAGAQAPAERDRGIHFTVSPLPAARGAGMAALISGPLDL